MAGPIINYGRNVSPSKYGWRPVHVDDLAYSADSGHANYDANADPNSELVSFATDASGYQWTVTQDMGAVMTTAGAGIVFAWQPRTHTGEAIDWTAGRVQSIRFRYQINAHPTAASGFWMTCGIGDWSSGISDTTVAAGGIIYTAGPFREARLQNGATPSTSTTLDNSSDRGMFLPTFRGLVVSYGESIVCDQNEILVATQTFTTDVTLTSAAVAFVAFGTTATGSDTAMELRVWEHASHTRGVPAYAPR